MKKHLYTDGYGFSFAEVALIARTLHISIDPFIHAFSPEERPFMIPLVNFVEPTEIDYRLMEIHNEQLRSMANSEGIPEITETCNFIPAPFHYKYELITRFYIFKWLYKYKTPREATPFSQVKIDKRQRELQYEHYDAYKKILKRSHYILDPLIFYYIVNDLKYFSGIELITGEEIREIKKELYSLIEEVEYRTSAGRLPEEDSDLRIYISTLNLDTNYLYMFSDTFRMAAIKVFMLSYAASLDKETVMQFKKWIESFKKHSILISGCNELYQQTFFNRQRKIVAQL